MRGRSYTLRINHRTSNQIRLEVDRLLPSFVSDADDNAEGWRGTVSMFDGTSPLVTTCKDEALEAHVVGRCRNASRAWQMMRICRRSMTLSGTCYMWPAPVPGITCWSAASTRSQSFLMIFREVAWGSLVLPGSWGLNRERSSVERIARPKMLAP